MDNSEHILIFIYDFLSARYQTRMETLYRRWRNSVLRFGGWITFKNWTSDFKRNVFSDKINYARASLCSRGNLPEPEADVFYDRFCQMILFRRDLLNLSISTTSYYCPDCCCLKPGYNAQRFCFQDILKRIPVERSNLGCKESKD